MATFPLIFPSLSRQPSMDSSKTVDDDTIRDQMESGYVATRPRYTRARRTWKINVRNLALEDVRALDEFFMLTTARGGNSFLYPNVLPNWSFEFPALSAAELVFGWNMGGGYVPQETISITTATVEDGSQAISFASTPGQSIAAGATATGTLNCSRPVPVTPGDVYVFTAQVNGVQGTLPAGALKGSVQANFYTATGAQLAAQSASLVIASAGWQQLGATLTVPATAATMTITLATSITNSGSAALAVDGSSSLTWDEVGCALQTPVQPYGRMAGTNPLGCLLRFSKLPEISDIGYGAGVKRYGVNFELTEV